MFSIKYKPKVTSLVITLTLSLMAVLSVSPLANKVSAVTGCPDGYPITTADADPNFDYNKFCAGHMTVTKQSTATIPNAPLGGDASGKCQGPDLNAGNCGIIYYLVTGINILSGLVGVVIVMMIAIGGIQYSTARDNPQAVAAAKARITNAIIALVASLFIYAFLQYIVPGGLL